jgi:hypothetical protein
MYRQLQRRVVTAVQVAIRLHLYRQNYDEPRRLPMHKYPE